MERTEKQLWFYSSLLIAILLNGGRLLALRENGIAAHYWHFDAAAFTYQLVAQFAFCYLLFYLNLKNRWLSGHRLKKHYLKYLFYNALISFLCLLVFGAVQKHAFLNPTLIPGAFWASYFIRYTLAAMLAGIITQMILLLRKNRQQSSENDQLKNAYTIAELELLKEQLNPHFLFNSLSSLSGVVRENPALAQDYIKHLSRVYRYTLEKPLHNLVTVNDELVMVQSFAQLLKMRFEDAFQLKVAVDKQYLNYRLPHLSLQPLLENAAKHNAVTLKTPLLVTINIADGYLTVINNLNVVVAESTGTGLANLSQRFKILLQQEINIQQTALQFIVKLPILHE